MHRYYNFVFLCDDILVSFYVNSPFLNQISPNVEGAFIDDGFSGDSRHVVGRAKQIKLHIAVLFSEWIKSHLVIGARE